MASLLEELAPIVELMLAFGPPEMAAASMCQAIAEDDPIALAVAIGGDRLALAALRRARILRPEGTASANAMERTRIAEGIALSMAQSPPDPWELVATIPPFMGKVDHGNIRETGHVARRLISEARTCLVIASPFLDPALAGLAPAIGTFVMGGGRCRILTRDLRSPTSPNAKAIGEIRSASGSAGPLVEVASWDEAQLGIHMKVILVDSEVAYVGSANLTWGGLADHMEVGVLVRGSRVKQLEMLLEEAWCELRRRAHLQAR